MKNISYKKWIVSFCSFILIITVMFGTFNFIADPMLRYRTEDDGIFTYYEYAEMYSNPGIARNYTYDAVHVGTSMIQNTDIDEINELENLNMIRCAYSGGTAYNMKRILDICFDSKNKISEVYWELDEFQLTSKTDETRYPLPEYLYNDSHLRDIEYLLNVDIFYHYTLKNFINTLQGVEKKSMPRGITWTDAQYGREITLSSVTFDDEMNEQIPVDSYIVISDMNLDKNIIPFIENNPGTQFTFFIPPFSVLYWYKTLADGTFDANVYCMKHVVGRLLEYSNVSVYFFRNEYEIISDLDNYKDYSHYCPEINSYISRAISENKNLLTKTNYISEIDRFSNYIYSYDFSIYFE